jgi:DUF1009 family protein
MIGLFLGNRNLPKLIIKSLNKKKIKYFIIDLTSKNIFKKNKNSYFINIGKFGKILNLIKEKKCKNVIFAGNIDKPKISQLKLDLKGVYYIPRIIKASKKGDAAILKELIKILSENKVRVLKLNKFNPELTLKKGTYTKIKPTLIEKKEIKLGIDVLKKTNSYDHIQALVVRNKKVIAIEKSSGTHAMLSSIKKTKNKNGFLIKLPKKNQDLRADLPTIGFETIKNCKRIGLKGIILKSEKNIVLDKTKIINFSDKNKMILDII